MKKVRLFTLEPGAAFYYHDRETTLLERMDGKMFVQLTNSIGDRPFGKTNDWRKSSIREYLNGDFAKVLTDGNPDELLDIVTDLTAMDGTTDYGSSVDKVTLLTVDQNRKYRYVRSLPEDWEWLSTPASTPGGWDEDARYAWFVNTGGDYSSNGCSGSFGIRPAFALSPSLFVEVPGDEGLDGYSDAELLNELLKRQ